jgi:copper homeostasis protein
MTKPPLLDAVNYGFKTVLTSVGSPNAVEGVEVLHRLVRIAKGIISVMPGGGVRSSNIKILKSTTTAGRYHSSAILDGDQLSIEEIAPLKKRVQVN